MKRSYHINKFRLPLLFGAGVAILYATHYISKNTNEQVDFNNACRVITIYDNIHSCKLDYTDQSLKICDTAFSKHSFEKTALKIKYANHDTCLQEFKYYCKYVPEGSHITPKAMAISHYGQKHHIVYAVFERNGELIYGDYSPAQNQPPAANCLNKNSSGRWAYHGHGSNYAHTTGRSGFGSLGGAHGAGG